MSAQNLVSATLSTETKANILSMLKDIKKKLNFLISLQADEIQALFKAGNGYAPFVEKAYNTVVAHPDIMPAVFDIEEFKRDYQLSKDLVPIANEINQLAESLQSTQIAVNSDAVAEALEVYAAVKQNKDKVPGLKVTADEMAVFFKKVKKSSKKE